MIVYLSFEWVDYYWVDFAIVWFNLNAPDIGISMTKYNYNASYISYLCFHCRKCRESMFYVCKAKNVNFGQIEHC